MKLLTTAVALFLILFTVLAAAASNPLVRREQQKKNINKKVRGTGGPAGNLLWKSQISSGSIYSSPTSTYNTVYVGSNENTFYSVNGDDGHVVWSFDTQGPVKSAATICYSCGKNSGRIYFGANDGLLRILGLDEGYLMGQFQTNGTIYSRPFIHEIGGVPTVIIGSFDQNVYGLSDEGALKWKFTTGGAITASVEVYNNIAVVGSFDGNVYGIDMNGNLVWKANVGGRVATACLYSQPNVFCGTLEGAVVALNALTGAIVWKVEMPGASPSGSSNSGSSNNNADSYYHKIIAKESGAAGATTLPPPASNGITGRMAVDGNILYVGSGDALYAVSAVTGQISLTYNSKYNIGDGIEYLDGHLFFGAGKSVVCLLANNFTESWKFRTEGRVTTRPLVESLAFVGDDQGYLYALHAW